MQKDDPFDLEKLRLTQDDVKTYAGKAAPARRRPGRDFTIVPRSWSDRLKSAGARHVNAYKLAMYLLYQHWRTGGRPLTLTNVALTGTGVTRRSKWRALRELERLGLIEVKSRRRRSPIVSLLKLN